MHELYLYNNINDIWNIQQMNNWRPNKNKQNNKNTPFGNVNNLRIFDAIARII